MIEDVYVIAYCRSMDLFYGSSLFAETVRVGFPSAHIRVIENGSIPEASSRLKDLAKTVDAEFVAVAEHPHWELVQNIFMNAQRPFAIIDPDVIFWEKMDDENGLISGRLIPTFLDPFSECITKERLHTSLLKVSDPEGLKSTIHNIAQNKFEWRPFMPVMLEINGQWIRYDTAAALYASIKTLAKPFGIKELDAYDHLFCGSHLDQVLPRLGAFGEGFLGIHREAANGNIKKLRGIWRIQEEFFESHRLRESDCP